MNEINKRVIKTSEEEKARLDWAFSIINEFMEKSELAVLKCEKLSLVMTYLGEM